MNLRNYFAIVTAASLFSLHVPAIANTIEDASAATTEPSVITTPLSPASENVEQVLPMDHDSITPIAKDASGAHDARQNAGCDGGPGTGRAMTAIPSLPPGNEKLQLQMEAEMMQKMGEILAKYAAKVVEPAGVSTPSNPSPDQPPHHLQTNP